jgi:hypothetical protein
VLRFTHRPLSLGERTTGSTLDRRLGGHISKMKIFVPKGVTGDVQYIYCYVVYVYRGQVTTADDDDDDDDDRFKKPVRH